jgi:hypothetical protein
MKKKIRKEFEFENISKLDYLSIMNEDIPIDIKNLEELINKLSNRLPQFSKYEIANLVKYSFQFIRESLVLGVELKFLDLFNKMTLNVFRIKDAVTMTVTPNKVY